MATAAWLLAGRQYLHLRQLWGDRSCCHTEPESSVGWGWGEEGPHKGLSVSIKGEVVLSPVSRVPCSPHALGRQCALLLFGRASPGHPEQSRFGPGGQPSRVFCFRKGPAYRDGASGLLIAEVNFPASPSGLNMDKPLCPASSLQPGATSQISG